MPVTRDRWLALWLMGFMGAGALLAYGAAFGDDASAHVQPLVSCVQIALVPVVGLFVSYNLTGTSGPVLSALTAVLSVPGWSLFLLKHGTAQWPPNGARQLFLRLDLIDPGIYAGVTISAVVLALIARRGEGAMYDFSGVEPGGFGDARWMSMSEAGGVFPDDGEIVVGELYRPDEDTAHGGRPFDPRVRTSWGVGGSVPLATFKLDFDSTHMLFFAGSGGFKTTSTVVPTALRFSGSMVVLDPSGEVAPLVMDHRMNMGRGRRIAVLDPSQPPGQIEGFNVLAPLLSSTNREADAVAFARLLLSETPGKQDASSSYFQAQAHNLMSGLLLHVLTDDQFERARTLRSLRSLTALPEKTLKVLLADICAVTPSNFIRETLSPFDGMAAQTFTGISSSVAKDTQWLSLESYAQLVCGTTFEAGELADGCLDVFIQIPGDILKSYPGIARTVIGSLMRSMVQAGGQHKKRVLFALDEVDLLGTMNVLEEARDRGRKYGITLMLMYQSVGQLEHHYGKEGATSWFEGVSFVSYAAIKSMATAKDVSERCGEKTIRVENQSAGTSMLYGPLSTAAAGKQTQSFSLQKRALILPHEVVQDMRSDEQIIAIRGQRPLRLGRAIYFRRPEMVALMGAAKFK
jgi:type IV secretion system protein VirD4